MIEVIVAGDEVIDEDVAQGMALGANHGVASRVELGLHDNVVLGFTFVRWVAVEGDVFGSGAVTAFAVDAEIYPRRFVGVLLAVVILLLMTDVAAVTGFVPELNLDAGRVFRIANVKVVKPVFAKDIPTGREQNDAAVGEG